MEHPPITVYTQPECRPCKRVISQLEKTGLDFEVVDLTENEDARTYVTEVLGAKSVPVIVTDTHEPIVGYQPDKLKALVEDLTSNGEPS